MTTEQQPILAAITLMVQAHAEAATLGDRESGDRVDTLYEGLVGTIKTNTDAVVGHILQHMIGVILTLIWYDAEGNETVDTVPGVMERLEAAMDTMALEAARVDLRAGDDG